MTEMEMEMDSPDEFSVAPVIMKDAECSLIDNLIAEKLILPTFRPDAPVLLHSRPEEDWSIRSKCRQDKLLCYQVVYKRTLSIFHEWKWEMELVTKTLHDGHSIVVTVVAVASLCAFWCQYPCVLMRLRPFN